MKKAFVILGIIGIIILLLLSTQMVYAAGQENWTSNPQAKFSDQTELVDQRTANSCTFRDSKGQKTMYLSGAPINYQGDDGHYYPIDTYIDSNPLTNNSKLDHNIFKHHAHKNSLHTYFADTSDNGVHFENNGKSIEFILIHKTPSQAVVSKNKIRYAKVFANCDMEYTVLSGRVKDQLVFSSAPDNATITYKVNTSKGLKVVKTQSGNFKFIDKDGNPIFSIEVPSIFEQNNPTVKQNVTTQFRQEQDGLYCDLILDPNWLKDPNRNYPVVVDPVVSIPFTYSTVVQMQFPNTYGNINCTLNYSSASDGCSGTSYGSGYFKNLTTSQTYISGSSSYQHPSVSQSYSTAITGGNVYQISITTGTATITYGDANGCIFPLTIPNQEIDMNVSGYTITKTVTLKVAQQVSYNYVRETAVMTYAPQNQFFSITGLINGQNQTITLTQPQTGTYNLSPGTYTFQISPQIFADSGDGGTDYLTSDYHVELDFAQTTSNFENKIIMGTNPGYIDTTFIPPTSGQLSLEYEMAMSTNFLVNSTPSIQLWQRNGTPSLVYQNPALAFKTSTSSSNPYAGWFNFNNYCNGVQIPITGGGTYGLVISRAAEEDSGDTLSVQALYPVDAPGNISFVDANNGAITFQGFVQSNYHIAYTNVNGNAIQSGTISVQKVGSNNPPQVINLGNISLTNNMAVLCTIQNFGLNTGDQFNCTVQVSDGYVTTTNTFSNVVIHDSQPVIQSLSATIAYNVQDDSTSCIQNMVLSWSVNGQPYGTINLPAGSTSYQLDVLPLHSQVQVTLTVYDYLGYTASRSLTFSTTPQITVPGGTLSTNTNWTGIIQVTSDLTIPPGVTLTINPGTTIQTSPNCAIIVNGNLQIGADVTFDSTGGGLWNGIQYSGANPLVINYATIQNAVRGVACIGSGSVSLQNTVLRDNTCGVHCYSGTITIANCTLSNNTAYGIKEDNGCQPVVTNCSFTGNSVQYYSSTNIVTPNITVTTLNANSGNGSNTFQ